MRKDAHHRKGRGNSIRASYETGGQTVDRGFGTPQPPLTNTTARARMTSPRNSSMRPIHPARRRIRAASAESGRSRHRAPRAEHGVVNGAEDEDRCDENEFEGEDPAERPAPELGGERDVAVNPPVGQVEGPGIEQQTQAGPGNPAEPPPIQWTRCARSGDTSGRRVTGITTTTRNTMPPTHKVADRICQVNLERAYLETATSLRPSTRVRSSSMLTGANDYRVGQAFGSLAVIRQSYGLTNDVTSCA